MNNERFWFFETPDVSDIEEPSQEQIRQIFRKRAVARAAIDAIYRAVGRGAYSLSLLPPDIRRASIGKYPDSALVHHYRTEENRTVGILRETAKHE